MKYLDIHADKAVLKFVGGLALATMGLLMAASPTASAANKTKLSVYTTGTPAVGLPCTPSTPSAVLMGGRHGCQSGLHLDDQ
ncbi:hypothetical protein SAMN04515620_12369 [Collimonas sp. OK607]|nr:hypothetical protein SAMN04515620_12369 [Collimonas sp. OK607]